MKVEYVCSICRKRAVVKDAQRVFLVCGCDKGSWVSDTKGGHYANSTGAKPILSNEEPPQQYDVIKLRRKPKSKIVN